MGEELLAFLFIEMKGNLWAEMGKNIFVILQE